jgi:hypothetical protein
MAATETVMHGLRDPYAYLLQELHDRDSGDRPPWAPGQRQQLLDDLLVIEALELAHGKRHLSVVFDDPADPIVDDEVHELLAALTDALFLADDLRLTHAPGRVTVTVAGARASEWIARAEEIPERHERLSWRLVESPRA